MAGVGRDVGSCHAKLWQAFELSTPFRDPVDDAIGRFETPLGENTPKPTEIILSAA